MVIVISGLPASVFLTQVPTGESAAHTGVALANSDARPTNKTRGLRKRVIRPVSTSTTAAVNECSNQCRPAQDARDAPDSAVLEAGARVEHDDGVGRRDLAA